MPTPNPACLIGGLATPVDVAANSTISGSLASPAGAVFWALACIATDGTVSVAAVNATLVLNQGAKTFSFTSGAAGTAYIFQSTVGIDGPGLDVNGQLQPSFSTTFKVNVPTTTHQLRVLVAGERFEQDAVNGWVNELNAVIRQVG